MSNRHRTTLFLYTHVRNEAAGNVGTLMLSHLQLDQWVTVEIRQAEGGTYEVAADVDGEPLGEGVGDTAQSYVM